MIAKIKKIKLNRKMLNKVMGDFKKFEILNHRFEKR